MSKSANDSTAGVALIQLINTLKAGDGDAVWAALDRCLASINRAIQHMLNEILHHPRYQQLERIWQGLAFLVESSEQMINVKIELLQATKSDLLEDFEEFLDLSDTGLFHHLYKSEYDQPGGEPYGCVLLNYEFGRSKVDVTLLKLISRVAASCHCPAVGNASPSLFGLTNQNRLEEVEDFDLLFQSPEFSDWKLLRQAIDSRYLGLVLPRFLARRPFRHTDSRTLFFEENCKKDTDFLWTYGTFAFASLVARSFHRHGWCIHIRGPKTGGMVPNLTPLTLDSRTLHEDRPPLEICFSDSQEHKLSDQGFIVLNYYKSQRGICVFSAPTLYVDPIGSSKRGRTGNSGEDVGSHHFAGSLPYLFLVSRLAHYQKVIQREHVGLTSDSSKIEKELQTWLNSLVTQMPNPDRGMRARYPLRDALVKVSEDESNPGFFSVGVVLKPHLQLEGVNAELTLISKLPRDKE